MHTPPHMFRDSYQALGAAVRRQSKGGLSDVAIGTAFVENLWNLGFVLQVDKRSTPLEVITNWAIGDTENISAFQALTDAGYGDMTCAQALDMINKATQ